MKLVVRCERQYSRLGTVRFEVGILPGEPIVGIVKSRSQVAHSRLPVIAVPRDVGPLRGVDAALASLQMPPGTPVAAVAVGILLLTLLSNVPCVGWALAVATLMWSVGAVVQSLFGTRPYGSVPAAAALRPGGGCGPLQPPTLSTSLSPLPPRPRILICPVGTSR